MPKILKKGESMELATKCPNCDGDGYVIRQAKFQEWDEPCNFCKGDGKIYFKASSKKEDKKFLEWLYSRVSYGSL